VWQELQFNTLVFLTNEPSVNTRRRGAAMQRSYVHQALALARSLESLGKTLRILTNDRKVLLEIMSSENHSASVPCAVQEVRFPTNLPCTIRFFAAHHKLFLFSVFAQETHYNCLLDTDVVANHAKRSLIQLLEENPRVDGWVYDISDQVFPAFGTAAVQDDLRRNMGVEHPFPRWYGGEFIIGNARLFNYLHEECSRHLATYIETSSRLHMSSDECLVSAALNSNHQNLILADAGASGLVVRHWASKTRHVKKPPSVLSHSLFWHLPNAKDALALYRKHGSLRILYRHVQGLSVAKHAIGYLRESLRRVQAPRATPAIS
jgi:hypothetical protein